MIVNENQDLNWNYLYYFYAVMKHRSVKRAAHELDIASSSVSEGLRTLEVQLNCKLLSRTTRKIEPTARGNALFDRIKSMFESRSQILKTVEVDIKEQSTLSMGIVSSNSVAALMPSIVEMMLQISGTKLVVKNCTQQSFEKMLVEGEIDFGLTAGHLRSKSAVSSLLFNSETAFYGHRSVCEEPSGILFEKCKIGLLGSDEATASLQSRIFRSFPGSDIHFLVSDYPSMLLEACSTARAIVAVAARGAESIGRDLYRIRDERLNSVLPSVDQYLVWAKRIEGSSLHDYLRSLPDAVSPAP